MCVVPIAEAMATAPTKRKGKGKAVTDGAVEPAAGTPAVSGGEAPTPAPDSSKTDSTSPSSASASASARVDRRDRDCAPAPAVKFVGIGALLVRTLHCSYALPLP